MSLWTLCSHTSSGRVVSPYPDDFVGNFELSTNLALDAAYKADPPPEYDFPAYDLFAAASSIRQNLVDDVYTSEYAFQSALYEEVFGPGHDGHFVYYPDLLTAVFEWTRQRGLVSISEDGSSLPVIKIYGTF